MEIVHTPSWKKTAAQDDWAVTPEDSGSNPVISNYIEHSFTLFVKNKTVIEVQNGPLEEKITIFIKIGLQILTKALITETLHFESRENQGDQIWRFYK